MPKRNDLQLDDELKYRLFIKPDDMFYARQLVRRQTDWQELFFILGIDDQSMLDPYKAFYMFCTIHKIELRNAANGSMVCHRCKNERQKEHRKDKRAKGI